MISGSLWLDMSNIAHSLSGRHKEMSLFRPQYFAILVESLADSAYADVRKTILDDVTQAVTAQCKSSISPEDEELLWEAFGIERLDPRFKAQKRSGAFDDLPKLLSSRSLPSEVVSQAGGLCSDASMLASRILPISSLSYSDRLYPNPLSLRGTLWALANWKLGMDAPEVDVWRDWLTTLVYQQVRFRFKLGIEPSIEMEDFTQDCVVKVLQQLCIYQPGATVTLERWVFNVIHQSVSMSLRSHIHQFDQGVMPDVPEGEKAFLLPAPRLPEDEASHEQSELVEFAITQMKGQKRQPRQSVRIKIFLGLLGTLLGAEAPRDADELVAQLRKFFPNISGNEIQLIVEHSGLRAEQDVQENEEVL